MQALCNLTLQYGQLAGRFLITAIFLISGYHKIIGFAGVSGMMAKMGMPFPDLLVVGAIVFELGGGLMVLLGWYARWGALLLFIFTIPATLMFHNFWAMGPAEYQNQLIHFQKNLAILGGLAILMAVGSGPYSLKKESASASAH